MVAGLLRALRSGSARVAAVDPELTSRVRALTTELGHLGAGMSEVERLLAPERTLEVTPT